MQNINSVGKELIKLFRYGTVTMVALSGFVLSFFMFSYYNSAKRIDINEADDREKYAYNSSVAFVAYGKAFDFECINYEEFAECDVVVADTLFYVGDSDYPRTSDVVLHSDKLIYPLIEGRYPNQQDLESGAPCVVLGKYLKRDTYSKCGKDYIKINGDEYYVTGYIAAEKSTILDYKVILYYQCIGDNAKKDIEYYKNNAGVFITFNSETDILGYRELLDKYVKLYPDNLSETYYDNFKFTDSISADSRKIAVIIYIFSIVVIVLAVVYWYMSNQKEFAIRRACGYSIGGIILLIARRLMVLLGIALLISELIIFRVNWLEKDFDLYNMENYANQITVLLKYIIITVPVVLLFPIIKVCTDKPDALLRKAE